MPPWDHEGYAELANSLDMRIATGENEYNKHAFIDLLLKKGADVVQPDNRRGGGPTEWIEIGAIADGFGVELAWHRAGENGQATGFMFSSGAGCKVGIEIRQLGASVLKSFFCNLSAVRQY